MKKLLLIAFLFVCSIANAQIYYYQSGNPSDPSNWNTQLDGSGGPALNFTAPTDYVIPTGRTALAFSSWSFGGMNSKLRVYAGATLENTVGITINSNSFFSLDSGSVYINNNESTADLTIFNGIEIFNKYSTVRINDWSGTNKPVISGVSIQPDGYYFGNLEINWVSNSGDWYQNLTSTSPALCENNFILTSTGSGRLLFHGVNLNTEAKVQVNGNFIQKTGTIIEFSFNASSPTINSAHVILKGNLHQEASSGMTSNGAKTGKISFAREAVAPDTAFQTYFAEGIISTPRIFVNQSCRLKLLSNMTNPYSGADTIGLTVSINAIVDFGVYKLIGHSGNLAANGLKTIGFCYLYIGSPDGYRQLNGSQDTLGNVIVPSHNEHLSPLTVFVYNGNTPQVIGDRAPDRIPILAVRNPNGVTLNKNIKVDNSISLDSGKLNLSDYNLIVPNIDLILNASFTNFINTNGTGALKTYIGTDSKIIPIGNGTYSPVHMVPTPSSVPDTFAFRVANNFAFLPPDTSYCVRKSWNIVENNPGGSIVSVRLQWMRTDEPGNFKAANISPAVGSMGLYNPSYAGYIPKEATTIESPFSGPPDTTIARSAIHYLISGYYTEFNPSSIFIVGTERGVQEFYFYNINNAASLSSWKKNENGTGVSPVSFDRYAIFNVTQNKNAVFNTSVTFSNKTQIRVRGNGQFTTNQPVTNLGKFSLFDSSSYNHNNIGIAENTIFAGREEFLTNGRKSHFNILMWSDTAHGFRKGISDNIANLTINFTNLADPGPNGRWRNAGILAGGVGNRLCINLTYIQSSGYDLCLVGDGYNTNTYYIDGDLKLGDSILAPDVHPVINLSYGTSKSSDSLAGSLLIGGDMDIQCGGIHSEQNVFTARGRLIFNRGSFGKSKHYISSYQPLDIPIFNCGSNNFPNALTDNTPDTVVLKTNFYNSQNSPFGSADVLEIQDRNVLDCDTFALRGMGIRVKAGGKIIIRNKAGMNFELNALQNITLEPGAMIEFAGYEAQNLYKTGSTTISNIPTLIINNQNGVTLNDVVTVTDTLKFIQGKVNSGPVHLNLTDTTASIGMNATSYIDAPIRLFTTSTISKMIPFGKNGKLRPLYFQPAATNPTQWVMWFDTQDPHLFGSAMGPGITSISNNEYYEINRFGSTIGAYVGLSFGPGSGVSAAESLRVARWTGSMWENKGVWYYTGVESGYVMSDYVSDFSPFAIATTNQQPLPVELASFNASIDRNNVNLEWNTTSEINNSGFDVERKLYNDSVWQKISFVQGNGNSNQLKNYKFNDRNLSSGKYNYRLKQIDHNGNFSYFNLQSELNVGIPNDFSLSQNYPNPFNPATKIDYDLPYDSKVSLKVYDILGREISNLVNNELQRAGYYNVQFNAVNFASGTYFFRIVAQGGGKDFVMTKKMQLVK